MIVASFSAQYGIRMYQKEFKEMKWVEFSALLSGLGPDTPLGRIVAIRSEEDEEVIKHFNSDQKRIHSEWRRRRAKNVSQEQLDNVLENLKQAFIHMAGGEE